jgi:hypothetical protein
MKKNAVVIAAVVVAVLVAAVLLNQFDLIGALKRMHGMA